MHNQEVIEMDLSDGKYLGHDIEAVAGDWLIVYDGKYNYYLFDSSNEDTIRGWKNSRLPRNIISYLLPDNRLRGGAKHTEFYTEFDNAIKNLCKVVANNGKWV